LFGFSIKVKYKNKVWENIKLIYSKGVNSLVFFWTKVHLLLFIFHHELKLVAIQFGFGIKYDFRSFLDLIHKDKFTIYFLFFKLRKSFSLECIKRLNAKKAKLFKYQIPNTRYQISNIRILICMI